jgi:hypothetical protein
MEPSKDAKKFENECLITQIYTIETIHLVLRALYTHQNLDCVCIYLHLHNMYLLLVSAVALGRDTFTICQGTSFEVGSWT